MSKALSHSALTLLLALLLGFAGMSEARAPAERTLERRREVRSLVQQILGEQNPGSPVARLKYLGEEALAVRALEKAWGEGLGAEQQRAVAAAYVLLEHPSAAASLAEFLKAPDPVLRMAGAEGLGRLRAAAAQRTARVKLLMPLLTDASLGVRREAARALERLGARGAGAALLEAASAEGDPELRVAMLSAAGTSGESALTPRLLRFLESSSEATRFAATRALCRLGAKEGLAEAKAKLASGDKRQAIALLEGASLADATPLLEPLLKETDVSLAAAAARTLLQNGDARMLAWLVLSSANSSADTRLVFERELERVRVTDEQRRAILHAAGKKP